MRHTPVLINEVIDNLQLKSGMNVIDCTLGDGGHTEKILEKIIPNGKVLGIDADPEAILQAKQYLYRFENNLIVARDNFTNLQKIVKKNDFSPVNGILMDLGWSSPQFTERNRGFSFQNLDEPLDMRYEGANSMAEDGHTASDILNNYSEADLDKIFKKFGEESNSQAIAEAIIKQRQNKKISTVGELVNIILSVTKGRGKIHPATKVFQALRIEVNQELEVLRQALPQAVDILDTHGRLAVISFHSLEDRIIKQFFQKQERSKKLKIINKKVIIASDKELLSNPKSRSAKLRVIEKI